MKVANICLLCIVVIFISSCGIQEAREMAELKRVNNQYLMEARISFNREKESLAQEVAAQNAKNNAWAQKWDAFLNSLSNTELKAYSEMAEAIVNHNDAKIIIYRRNFGILLIQSDSPGKYVLWQKLVREGVELNKKNDELNAKVEDINKRTYKIAQIEADMKAEQKHEETVSAIKGISSSIDSMRFDLEQWRMQKFLGMQ